MEILVFLIIFIILVQPWISILAVDGVIYLIIETREKRIRFEKGKPVGMDITRTVKIHKLLCF